MSVEQNNCLKKGINSLLLKGIFPRTGHSMAILAMKFGSTREITSIFAGFFGYPGIFKPGLVWGLWSARKYRFFYMLSSLIPGNGEERSC